MATLVWLLCFALSSVSVVAVEAPRAGDLVFCPLQKLWVKGREPEKMRPPDALAAICAANTSKTSFLEKLAAAPSIKVTAANAVDAYFSFQTDGSRALMKTRSAPDVPQIPLTVVSKLQSTAGSGHVAPVTGLADVFSFQQHARPPTGAVVSNYLSQQIPHLRPSSFAIIPRGPPVLFS